MYVQHATTKNEGEIIADLRSWFPLANRDGARSLPNDGHIFGYNLYISVLLFL